MSSVKNLLYLQNIIKFNAAKLTIKEKLKLLIYVLDLSFPLWNIPPIQPFLLSYLLTTT